MGFIFVFHLLQEIKFAGCGVLKHLNNFPTLSPSGREGVGLLKKLDKELSDPKTSGFHRNAKNVGSRRS